ncbi:DNA methyltransferase 1-associated protein 1-like [Diadema setosum]|uniref:DNA methyltransferase 1-associated protein 1-like n=1 Tax=Diadema setosum TaxID=31175 RepID=UPI003B3A8CE3
MVDVRDILEWDVDSKRLPTASLGDSGQSVKKTEIIGEQKKQKPKKNNEVVFKRPEGMHREVYALLYSDNKDPPPLIPSDSNNGYKSMKVKLGRWQVRPWKWMSFTNPARKDGAVFHHWRRIADEGKDYPFARFDKAIQIPIYTDQEYQLHLHSEKWTRLATDHMFDLCSRFDLRWVIVHDRFDHTTHGKRSVEDMKERYYSIVNKLAKVRSDPSLSNKAPQAFDAEHERRRKEQLIRLYNRTSEQVEEEEMLIAEMKKIELRKKEREKKAQDLQKLITAADNNADLRRTERKINKKKIALPLSKRREQEGAVKIPETGGIKFPDFKQSGVYLRSQKMKLPSSVGLKKTKAIEHLLDELGIPVQPMPTEEVALLYNEVRSDMVLLYELKLALANCEFELQTLRHRYEALAPGKLPSKPALTLGAALAAGEGIGGTKGSSLSGATGTASSSSASLSPMTMASSLSASLSVGVEDSMREEEKDFKEEPLSPGASRKMTDPADQIIVDVVSTTPITLQQRKKRQAAVEQGSILKKLKK